MNTEFRELFKEFMELSYYPGKREKGLRDIDVMDYVIARVTEEGCRIIYIYSGASVLIPWGWIDLFSALNVHSGNRILNIGNPENDDITEFGILFTTFVIYLDKQLSGVNGSELLDILGDISDMGTSKFREWLKSEFSLTLEPLIYTSPEQNITI